VTSSGGQRMADEIDRPLSGLKALVIGIAND
jgi:hypothetical protein